MPHLATFKKKIINHFEHTATMLDYNITSMMNETRINNTQIRNNISNEFSCEVNTHPGEFFFAFITNGVLLNIVGFFGILGNIISMIILSRPQMKSSINYLLTGLARCDTVLILTSMLLFGLPSIYPYSGYLFTYYYNVLPHMAPVLYPLAVIVQTASVYLTLTVTLERYVAVCHPLKARSLCTYGRARIYVFVIIIFSVLYNLPRFWEIEHHSNFEPSFNTTIYCVVASKLRQNPTYISVYIHWLYLVFLYFLPFLFLAIFNVAIYRQVRKANAERQRLSRLQRREIGLATMLLIVVSVFFLCNILPLIVNILESFYGLIDDPLVKISNLLVTINSSINFIIYVIFGEKFKRLFLKLFCSHGLFGVGGRDSPDGATHDDSFMSCADRQSIRLQRTNTSVSRNGVSLRVNGTHAKDNQIRRSVRIRAPSPGPCVYYPALRGAGKEDISDTPPTQSTMVSGDWEHETSNTTGF